MALDGKWNFEIASPMGAQKGTLDLKVEGGKVTGTQGSAQGSIAVDGKADGDHATWSADVTTPMPMKLEFDITASGDTLSGTCKAGAFGTFPVKGSRA